MERKTLSVIEAGEVLGLGRFVPLTHCHASRLALRVALGATDRMPFVVGGPEWVALNSIDLDDEPHDGSGREVLAALLAVGVPLGQRSKCSAAN